MSRENIRVLVTVLALAAAAFSVASAFDGNFFTGMLFAFLAMALAGGGCYIC